MMLHSFHGKQWGKEKTLLFDLTIKIIESKNCILQKHGGGIELTLVSGSMKEMHQGGGEAGR